MFGRRRASGPPSKCHPLDTQVHREPPYSRGHPPIGRRRAGRPPVLKVSPPGYTGPPGTLGSRGWLFLAPPGYTGSPRTPVFEGWPKAHMRALSDLQHARILICHCNLQHLATCSTPEYWFSIVIYSTCRPAVHQNIDYLFQFTAL